MTALEYFQMMSGGGSPKFLAENVTLTNPNGLDLAFAATFSYFMNTGNPFWFVKKNVKDSSWKVTHLSSSGIAVQPQNGSCEFNPMGAMYSTSNEINICKFGVQDQICYDEFLEGCLAWLGGYELEAGNPNATPMGRLLMQAYLALKVQDIKSNILEVVWFGYKGYSGTAFDDAAPDGVPASELAKWKMAARALLTQCDGIIYAIQSTVLPNGQKTVVETTGGLPYLDAWDGVSLDTGTPITGSDIFKILKNSDTSSPLFRTAQKHGFIVSHGVYDAYYNELVGTGFGIPQQYALVTDGTLNTPVYGMPLMWHGIPVYHCPELDSIPYKYFGKVNAHAAIYTIFGNLCVGTDIQNTEGGTLAPELRIQRGAFPQDDMVYYKGKFKLGAGLGEPRLIKGMFSYDLTTL